MTEELIKVTVKNGQQSVSARELQKSLGFNGRFSKWVENNFSSFEIGKDFKGKMANTCSNNDHIIELQDYDLTLDMAKKLCIMSRTEEGVKVYNYLAKATEQNLTKESKMLEKMQTLTFNGHKIRKITLDGAPWFVGYDLAKALGYGSNKSNIYVYVDHADKKKVDKSLIEPGGSRGRDRVLISENGVYSIIASNKQRYREFKEWFELNALPSFDKCKQLKEKIAELKTQLENERERRLIAEQRVNELTPKADYCDRVLADKALVTTAQIAKDYGMSIDDMNTKLNSLGVQYKLEGTWMLYHEYQVKGWARIQITIETKTEINVEWTRKGRLGLYELLKQNSILPTIEQKAVSA